MNLNIFLTQESAEIFFREQLERISDVSLIQDTSEENPINGKLAWFCKSGGEKFVSEEKGVLKPFCETEISNHFRVIDRGAAFIFNDQLYTFGHKGRIGHPRIVDSSSTLRNACDYRLLKKAPLYEKLYRIKLDNLVINYCFGLFSSNNKTPIVRCLVFQEEADLFDPNRHVIEVLKTGERFEFMGGKYYHYSLNNWDVLIASEPR